jgi:uncharacterized protein (TIGR02996 family)
MSAREEQQEMERAFLADVVQHPRDDSALLIYADWLMDQPDLAAQTRGEYLRLTWLMERAADGAERKDLHWRTQALWWNHVESWLGPLYDAVDHFIYVRGRLCVEVSEEGFCRLSPDELADCPAWDWVTDLTVRKGGLGLLLHLGEAPRPPLLASVDVGRGSLEYGELEYLLGAGFWKGVAELDLRKNGIAPSDAAALAHWPGLAGVRRLDLEGCWIGEDGALSLSRSPYLDAIERLILTVWSLDGDSRLLLQERFGDRLLWE